MFGVMTQRYGQEEAYGWLASNGLFLHMLFN